MMIKPLIKHIGVAAFLFVAIGCSGNPTNEPTANDIKAANDNRAAAIDKDPSLNAEQKAKMKEMMGLNGKPAGR